MHSFLKSLALTLIATALSVNALAESWVDEIDKPPEAYKLTKNDKTQIPVSIFKNLENGDCIEVIGSDAKLWIASDSSPRQMLSHDGVSNKCIKEKDTSHNSAVIVFSNVVEWSGHWLTNRISSPTARSVVSAVARGDEPKGIAIPLANQGGLRMVAGKRPLYLAWQGGKQPFSVHLIKDDGQRIVFEQRNIKDRQVKIDPLSLGEGNYRIEIGDSVEMIAKNLRIVSSAEKPSPKFEAHGNKGLEDRAVLVEAVRLASQGNGWAFEAYQAATELAPRYQPAQILQDSLEQGDMPLPMPE